MTCPWCKHNGGACNTPELVAKCDFRELPYNKLAIIKRAKEEFVKVQKIREELRDEKSHHDMEPKVIDAADRVAGIKIMMTVLKDEFGVNDPVSVVGMPSMSTLDAIKMAIKLKNMEKNRGRTNGRS